MSVLAIPLIAFGIAIAFMIYQGLKARAKYFREKR
jgi:hypothetical protein